MIRQLARLQARRPPPLPNEGTVIAIPPSPNNRGGAAAAMMASWQVHLRKINRRRSNHQQQHLKTPSMAPRAAAMRWKLMI
jgi:hypothetical protein